jgi:hypothetical protein
MGVSGGPYIVRDSSLVLELDAADRNSYPGTGTTWRDLTANSFTGSLLNGPTFSSASLGNIVFDGVDDYVNISTTNLIVNTVNVWIYLKNTQGGPIIYSGTDTYDSNQWEWSIYIYLNTMYFRGNAGGLGAINYPASNYLNKWTNFTLIRDFNSKSYLYENGVYKNEASEASSVNTNRLRLVKGGQYANLNIANTQIYNRALSAQEVLQNYNATKTRFGL